jgi:hypothetical protein
MYPVIVLLGLMLLTWVAAIWATFEEETDTEVLSEPESPSGDPLTEDIRKVA